MPVWGDPSDGTPDVCTVVLGLGGWGMSPVGEQGGRPERREPTTVSNQTLSPAPE